MSSLISFVESSLANVTWRVFGFGEDFDFAVKKPTIPEGRTSRSHIVPRSRSQSRDEGNGRDFVSKLRRLALRLHGRRVRPIPSSSKRRRGEKTDPWVLRQRHQHQVRTEKPKTDHVFGFVFRAAFQAAQAGAGNRRMDAQAQVYLVRSDDGRCLVVKLNSKSNSYVRLVAAKFVKARSPASFRRRTASLAAATS